MIIKKMYINGQWVDAVSGKTRNIENPGNEEIIARVPEGDRSDAKAAIAAAREAFDKSPWRITTGRERGLLLYRLADAIESSSEELAELESLNTGKTVEESRWDMNDIAGIFRYYAGLADKEGGETLNSPIPESSSIIIREPVGVCGQISPWNYPLLQAAWKMAPALAAGCTIVMKPSEITPLTLIKLTELAEETGFPPGVINLILGPGGAGAELSESIDVDLISFTGGIETGKTIMKAASGNVKKIALELGGKNPHIIFADADMEAALDSVLNGVFFHAGQICSAGTRVMIEAPVHDQFVEKLKSAMSKIRLGYAFDKDTQMGPLISKAHREKIEDYVKTGIDEGAELVLGGKRPENPELSKGYYYLPTLFTGCTADMKIVQEESFGPVITVEKFHTEAEVTEKANNTIYGLSAGFRTKDPDRIFRMSRALRFGTVWINDFNIYFTEAPWGGYRQSGLGRELGKTGFEEYTELKHVFQNHNYKPSKWFNSGL